MVKMRQMRFWPAACLSSNVCNYILCVKKDPLSDYSLMNGTGPSLKDILAPTRMPEMVKNAVSVRALLVTQRRFFCNAEHKFCCIFRQNDSSTQIKNFHECYSHSSVTQFCFFVARRISVRGNLVSSKLAISARFTKIEFVPLEFWKSDLKLNLFEA